MSEDDSNTGRNLVIVAVVAVVALFVLAVVAVIGAAVIGAFVLDVGSTTTASTSAGFAYTHSGDEVVVEYEGGSVDPDRIELYVNGELRGTWSDLESTHGDDRTIRFDDLRSGDRIEIRKWSDDGTEILDSYTV